MPVYNEIIIDWKVRQRWNSASFEDLNNKSGVLYQIYCDSHIYGRDVLAYIGKTEQLFSSRFYQHLKSFFQFANNVNYAIGQIVQKPELKDYSLEIPESILIANHKPFFNKEFLHDLPDKAKEEKIIIINNGHPGMLKNSCTNFWWVD